MATGWVVLRGGTEDRGCFDAEEPHSGEGRMLDGSIRDQGPGLEDAGGFLVGLVEGPGEPGSHEERTLHGGVLMGGSSAFAELGPWSRGGMLHDGVAGSEWGAAWWHGGFRGICRFGGQDTAWRRRLLQGMGRAAQRHYRGWVGMADRTVFKSAMHCGRLYRVSVLSVAVSRLAAGGLGSSKRGHEWRARLGLGLGRRTT